MIWLLAIVGIAWIVMLVVRDSEQAKEWAEVIVNATSSPQEPDVAQDQTLDRLRTKTK